MCSEIYASEEPMIETWNADPSDVASIDAIITAAYDVISGPAGKKRDWHRERSLFIPGARLIPTAKTAGDPPPQGFGAVGKDVDFAAGRVRPTGGLAPQILDVDGYIARAADYLEQNGFFEKEIARRTERFGNIAHVWSTYESRYNPDDDEPFMRGVNSIQLFYDGSRWWIVTIYWQQESSDNPIPEKYLETKG